MLPTTTNTKLTNFEPSLQLEMVKPVVATKVVCLTGTYLYEVLKKRLKVELFDDVYSADKVPLGHLSDAASRQSRVCIVNCSTSLQAGSHFVALLIQADDILVPDSLALALSKVSPVLEKRLLKSKKKISYAFETPLQSLTSGFCGIYCMYFCLRICQLQFPKGRRLLIPFDARNGFTTDKNDKIVMHNFLLLINKNAQ
jgi:hypothetical protein